MQSHPLRTRPAALRAYLTRPNNKRTPLVPLSRASPPRPGGNELFRDPELAATEAALFVADEPLSARKVAALAALPDAATARRHVEKLRALLDLEGSAFQVEEIAGGYQLLTRTEMQPWLARLRQGAAEAHLTPAARETLTIIAYRQPVTRADVEAIRGVGAADVLRQLMERGLVRIAGRDDSLGRPALYETTRKFLLLFGLRGLEELPPGEGLFPAMPKTPDVST